MGEVATEIEAKLRPLVRRALGTEVRRIELIASGLGLRRFARVWTESREPATLIARIEAPEDPAGRSAELPPEPPLEPLRALLERAGFPFPKRYGGDSRNGIDLLEDLGQTSLAEAARGASRDDRLDLYAEACGLVSRLQRVAQPTPPLPAFQRRLDAAHLRYKAELFTTFSLATRVRAPTARDTGAVEAAFGVIAECVAQAPARLAHRDFQGENLLVIESRPPGRRLAMIDLQGAFQAPPEYDLVCLLRDSYVELPDEDVERHLSTTRTMLPDAPDPDEFRWRVDLLTLARKSKDHARFLHAARARGDRRYLPFVATTVRYLRAAGERAARLDPRLERFADLVGDLPESPCVP